MSYEHFLRGHVISSCRDVTVFVLDPGVNVMHLLCMFQWCSMMSFHVYSRFITEICIFLCICCIVVISYFVQSQSEVLLLLTLGVSFHSFAYLYFCRLLSFLFVSWVCLALSKKEGNIGAGAQHVLFCSLQNPLCLGFVLLTVCMVCMLLLNQKDTRSYGCTRLCPVCMLCLFCCVLVSIVQKVAGCIKCMFVFA